MTSFFRNRFVAVLTAIAFLLQGPAPTFAAPLPEHPLNVILKDLPSGFAVVHEVNAARGPVESSKSALSPSFVIHIQDAHANPEAQANIQAILSWLQGRLVDGKKKFFPVVAIEGTVGEIHPEYLELFPEYPAANEAFVSDLHQKGELDGIELYAWHQRKQKNKKTMPIVGVESAELYRKNLKTYRELLHSKSKTEMYLLASQRNLELIQSHILSPELRDHLRDQKQASSRLGVYLTYQLAPRAKKVIELDLTDRIEQLRFPNLTRLVYLEGIRDLLRPAKARREWVKITTALSRRDRRSDPVKAMNQYWQDSKTHSISMRTLLEDFIRVQGLREVSFEAYPNLTIWMAFEALSQEIEPEALMKEKERLERAVEDKLARTEDEKAYLEVYRDFSLFKKLLKLELTRAEYEKVLSRGNDLRPSEISRRVHSLSPASALEAAPELTGLHSRALGFYADARERDQVLLENALNVFTEQPARALAKGMTPVLILITGGFHTEGLRAQLKAYNFAYAVISPRIRDFEGRDLYQKVMLGENADLSAYFEDPTFLNKQQALFFKGITETAPPVLAKHYKLPPQEIAEWVGRTLERHPVLKDQIGANLLDRNGHTYLRVQSPPLVRSEFRNAVTDSVDTPQVLTNLRLYDFLNGGKGRLPGSQILMPRAVQSAVLRYQARGVPKIQRLEARNIRQLNRAEARNNDNESSAEYILTANGQHLIVGAAGRRRRSIDFRVAIDHDDGEDFRGADKRDALRDALEDDSVNYQGGKVVLLTSSLTRSNNRNAKLTEMEMLNEFQIIGVEEDQGDMVGGVTPISDLTHGKSGVEAVDTYLAELAKLDKKNLPEVLVLGVNDVVIGTRHVPGKGTTRETIDDRPNILKSLLALIRKGVKIVFISDDGYDQIQQRVGVHLGARIHKSLQGSTDFSSRVGGKVTVLLYSSGSASKMILNVDAYKPNPIRDPHYGQQYAMNRENRLLIQKILGRVWEDEEDVAHGDGLIGEYYFGKAADGPGPYAVPGEEDNFGKRKMVLSPRVREQYPDAINIIGKMDQGNIYGPNVVLFDARGPADDPETIRVVSIKPLLSRRSAESTFAEGQLDDREWFIEELVRRLSLQEGVEPPSSFETTPRQDWMPGSTWQENPPVRNVADVLARAALTLEEIVPEPKPEDEGSPLSDSQELIRQDHANEVTLAEKKRELELRYREASQDKMARAALTGKTDSNGNPVVSNNPEFYRANIEAAYQEMREVAREAFDIGMAALAEGNYTVAILFFTLAKDYRELNLQKAREVTAGSAYTLALSEEPLLPETPDDYLVKLDQEWIHAVNAHTSDLEKSPLWVLTVENIYFDLKIGPERLFPLKDGGKSFNQIFEVGNALVEMVLMRGEGAPSFDQKLRAAKSVALMARSTFKNGHAARSLNRTSGLSVDEKSHTLAQSSDLDSLEELLQEAWLTFSIPNMHGRHSRTALDWVARAGDELGTYYQNRHFSDAVELAKNDVMPKVVAVENRLRGKSSTTEMLEDLAKALSGDRDFLPQIVLEDGGLVIEIPPRQELDAGEIDDPVPILTVMGQRVGVVQASVEATLSDGTLGRNIKIGVAVKDREEGEPDIVVDANREGEAPLVIHSAESIFNCNNLGHNIILC